MSDAVVVYHNAHTFWHMTKSEIVDFAGNFHFESPVGN